MDPIPLPPLKRAFDIAASFVVLVVLSPLIAVFLALIFIERIFVPSSRGPVFYKEVRISQGKPFMLWKIRTFKVAAIESAHADGKTIHTKRLEQDSRNLTLTGTILRQIYMDEVPQLLSVLGGDMTFVGPRPTNQPNYENSLAKGHQAKRVLKAGLTGRFQTHKHVKYHLIQEQVDMEYAELCRTKTGPQIVLHDLSILLQTAVTVFRAEGL
jgi:lipopolysaccharide/colanic/teichoic acid biosynthesis glycosyltransferase